MTVANVWTPSMIATLRALHRGGGSFVEIARQMSAIFQLEISRNACIGKARRLELPMRADDGPRKSVAKPAKLVSRPVPVAAPIRAGTRAACRGGRGDLDLPAHVDDVPLATRAGGNLAAVPLLRCEVRRRAAVLRRAYPQIARHQLRAAQDRLGSLVLRLPAAQVGLEGLLRRHFVVDAVELQVVDRIVGDANPDDYLAFLA